MTRNLTPIAVLVSMLFALVVGVLAVIGSSALSTVAVAGGILVGAVWVVVVMLGRGGAGT